jgi:hypothetical protein
MTCFPLCIVVLYTSQRRLQCASLYYTAYVSRFVLAAVTHIYYTMFSSGICTL